MAKVVENLDCSVAEFPDEVRVLHCLQANITIGSSNIIVKIVLHLHMKVDTLNRISECHSLLTRQPVMYQRVALQIRAFFLISKQDPDHTISMQLYPQIFRELSEIYDVSLRYVRKRTAMWMHVKTETTYQLH